MKRGHLVAALSLLAIAVHGRPLLAQRILGLDVSTKDGAISQTQWTNLANVNKLQFAIIRASRGGTTGSDHRPGGFPSNDNTFFTGAERYDDPNFVFNINTATSLGMLAAPYHRSRADIVVGTQNSDGSTVTVANSGTNDANHFIQQAGAFMRPGYLPPMLDFEDGQNQRSTTDLVQFALDFSQRIYDVMGIHPSIYINGVYSSILQGGTAAQRDAAAKPTGLLPSAVSPGFPVLINARWPDTPNLQNDNPKDTASTFYGPFDDYGTSQPWNIWQYSSTGNLQGIAPLDLDVSHGDIEYTKDLMVPAVWMNNSSGDWSTLANWNSGQTPIAPGSPPGQTAPGQLTPNGAQTLPTPRAPGVAGPSVTDGQNDTVILERPSADITVTLSSGTYNIRKLYMRESLNITGGSLTINYDPNYNNDFDNNPNTTFPNALRSGPISAQFSGPVTLSGTGALTVDTLQVDATKVFTIAGGSLSFNKVNLMPHSTTPATIAVTGDLNFTPLNGAAAAIANGSGSGLAGRISLESGNRRFNVSDGAANIDLLVSVAISNGGLTKSGAGTLRLTSPNTYASGTTVEAGRLLVSNTTGSGTGTGNVTVSDGLLGGTGIITGNVVLNGGSLSPGESIGALKAGGVTFNAGSTFYYEYNSLLSTGDLLNANGELNIGNDVGFNLADLVSDPLTMNARLTLISYSNAWNGGVFSGYADGSHFNYNGNEFQIKYNDSPAETLNGGAYAHAVTLTVTVGPVPEPSTLALAAGVAALCNLVRTRRRFISS